jgi:hypothetical protein
VGILLTPGMRPSYRLDISVGELRFANTRGSVGGMRYGRYEDKGRGNKIQVSAVQRKGLRFGTRGEAVYEYGRSEVGFYDGDTVASLSSSCQATNHRQDNETSARQLVLTERVRAPAPLDWRAIVVLVRPAHVGSRTPTHPRDGGVPLLNRHSGGADVR